ncbi:MAG: hypothetical protein HYV75_07845 [Opitutae bacterium]|nr:hypothetical protein [Opitutae bacterium]
MNNIALENIDARLEDERFTVGPVENMVLQNVAVNGKPEQAPGYRTHRE